MKEAGGPGVACARGVDGLGDRDRVDAVELGAAGDPSAVFTHLDGSESTMRGEAPGEFVVGGGFRLIERVNLVFVGEHDVDALVKLGHDPVAGDVDDFEGGEVDADRATGGAGGRDDGGGESGVEHQVALDVGVAAVGKVGGADLVGREGHRGSEAGAHGALTVGRDQGEAAGVGEGRAFEAGAVDAMVEEVLVVGIGGFVGADFAQITGFEPEAGGGDNGVGGGTAGGAHGAGVELGDEAVHLIGIDEFHAALGAADVLGEEFVGDTREQVHDGIAGADEVVGGHR